MTKQPEPGKIMNACQCKSVGVLRPGMADWYDSEKELPFVKHDPGQCKCTNDIRLFRRNDGTEVYLCSCCRLSIDTPISEDDRAKSIDA